MQQSSFGKVLKILLLLVFFTFQMEKFSKMVKETTGIKSTKERKLTVMMFSVVFLYIVANTFYIVGAMLHYLDVIAEAFYIFKPIYSFLWVISSSANLFLYLYFNKTFRNNFISIFSCTKTNQNVLGVCHV